MRMQNYEMRILVGGKPIHEYPHDGHVFVEGRKNSEFEIEFKNNTNGRVLVVPSVNGLSTIDGTPATLESMGYVVAPHATLKIPGWTVDDGNIAKFIFQDKDRSYTRTVSPPGQSQAGVIGVLVYGEEQSEPPKVVTKEIHHHHHHHTRRITTPPYNPPWSPTPVAPTPWNPTPWNPTPPIWYSTSIGVSNSVAGSNMNSVTPQSVSATSTTGEASNLPTEAPSFELGTGWGSKAEFKTNNTEFNRGKMRGQLIVYYDTRRNLEKRGIEVVKRERTYLNDLPTPFQTVGCKPPPGWKG